MNYIRNVIHKFQLYLSDLSKRRKTEHYSRVDIKTSSQEIKRLLSQTDTDCEIVISARTSRLFAIQNRFYVD